MGKGLIVVLILALVVSWVFLIWVIWGGGITGGVVDEGGVESDFVGKKVVSKVIDGDTVIIEGSSVRLLGMDTDERGYPCYVEAKKRLEDLVMGREVVLEMDVEDKDMYDRYLRFIFLEGENVNLKMVEEGMAVARFGKGVKYKAEILAAEQEAMRDRRGCKWGDVEEVEKEDDKDTIVITSSDYECGSNLYNCGDFSSHAEAQAAFEGCGGVGNDVHQLDRDEDGVACETLS